MNVKRALVGVSSHDVHVEVVTPPCPSAQAGNSVEHKQPGRKDRRQSLPSFDLLAKTIYQPNAVDEDEEQLGAQWVTGGNELSPFNKPCSSPLT